jgi:hypothetical protein
VVQVGRTDAQLPSHLFQGKTECESLKKKMQSSWEPEERQRSAPGSHIAMACELSRKIKRVEFIFPRQKTTSKEKKKQLLTRCYTHVTYDILRDIDILAMDRGAPLTLRTLIPGVPVTFPREREARIRHEDAWPG